LAPALSLRLGERLIPGVLPRSSSRVIGKQFVMPN